MSKFHKTAPNVLVTGGAGYVGSHACKALAQAGIVPVTYDNLSQGHRAAVRWGPIVVADIGDTLALRQAMREFNISAVMHFAASAYVEESIRNPRSYYQNNLIKTIALLDAMLDEDIRNFVFSSSCATYGIPSELPIRETSPQVPVNPYGESKLAVERVLRWYGDAYQLKWISLRYFNAAGCDPDGEIGESHNPETHLLPLVIEALDGNQPVSIFGRDYSTPDGTAVRDYVHVTDLASAHQLALEYLLEGGESSAFNLGSEKGHSVQEIIESVEEISGRSVGVCYLPARPGDPPELVADSSLARTKLRWGCRYSKLNQIVRTALHWKRNGRNY
jgi:UDP-glucose-4-epimerase GalE